jgi:ribosome biogenesis protein SSF1/2
VVLNNFGQATENQIQVMKVMFQNMLPTIDVKSVKLGDCRRVVLFNYRKEDGLVDMRHYGIRANPVGISRSTKKILQGKLPNLSQLEDVSEFMDHGRGLGAVSDSEAEDEESKVSNF